MGSSHDDSWPIVASATIIGSTCSFIVSRTLLSNFVNRLVANDKRYEALSLVLKHDGLKLLVMIRLCPLPYSISNGAISTFPTVQPLMFAAATAAATPKLLIAIFIGSRLAVIAKSGEKMDTTTKAINWASIIFGVILGVLTGWIIYKRLVFETFVGIFCLIFAGHLLDRGRLRPKKGLKSSIQQHTVEMTSQTIPRNRRLRSFETTK